jgi:hypothetical protein
MNLSKSIEFFYNKVIGTLLEDESDVDYDLLIAAATLMNDHNEA